MANPGKRRTTITVDGETLDAAQGYGFNLSSVCEAALKEVVRKKREQDWLDENREGIEANNSLMEDYEGLLRDAGHLE